MRLKLSAVLITLNAERCLDAVLASLSFADEILIVDSGSVDQTLEIAKKHNARVVCQAWLGFGPQKQFAVSNAAHDWVLCIDADEIVSNVLTQSIVKALSSPAFSAYRMARRNRFLGRWLAHGEGYPDWCLRLFDRRHARWSDDPVHERVLVQGPVGQLKGDLLHRSEGGVADYIAKQNRYTSIQADRLYADHRAAGMTQLVLSPMVRFIKFYILRQGFRDGLPGLAHIAIGCFGAFLKYLKLLEQKNAAKPGD